MAFLRLIWHTWSYIYWELALFMYYKCLCLQLQNKVFGVPNMAIDIIYISILNLLMLYGSNEHINVYFSSKIYDKLKMLRLWLMTSTLLWPNYSSLFQLTSPEESIAWTNHTGMYFISGTHHKGRTFIQSFFLCFLKKSQEDPPLLVFTIWLPPWCNRPLQTFLIS